jgi:hypothetical protein
MSLRPAVVVTIYPCGPAHSQANGSGGGRSAVLWLRGWQAHMTCGPRLVREHRTADRQPGRLALSLLLLRYQSDIILLGGRVADTTADGKPPDERTE